MENNTFNRLSNHLFAKITQNLAYLFRTMPLATAPRELCGITRKEIRGLSSIGWRITWEPSKTLDSF